MPELQDQIYRAEMQLKKAQEGLAKLRSQLEPEPMEDYKFQGAGGQQVLLSELFGDQDDLLVVHNMGRKCPSCTLWADEYNGVLQHLESRAAFAVSSPDSPEVQAAFAKERSWAFRMVSVGENRFAQDLGFHTEEGSYPGYQPGVSAFRREDDGRIVRVGRDFFGAGDLYCSVWHFFALLRDGVGDWDAKFRY